MQPESGLTCCTSGLCADAANHVCVPIASNARPTARLPWYGRQRRLRSPDRASSPNQSRSPAAPTTCAPNERRSIYRDDNDRISFIELARETLVRHHSQLLSFALMTNHYHLLIQTSEPNLAAGMHYLTRSTPSASTAGTGASATSSKAATRQD